MKTPQTSCRGLKINALTVLTVVAHLFLRSCFKRLSGVLDDDKCVQ